MTNKCRACEEDLEAWESYNYGLCLRCASVGGGGYPDVGRCQNVTVNEDNEEVLCGAPCSSSSQLCNDCRQQSLHTFWADAKTLADVSSL